MKELLMLIIPFLLIFKFGYSQKINNRQLIKKARLASNQAIKNHDLDRIASFWDKEILITTGSGVLLRNREEILAVLEKSFQKNSELYYVRQPRQIKVSQEKDKAWESGTWKSFGTTQRYEGRYTAMWVRVGGEWKIRSQLFVGL